VFRPHAWPFKSASGNCRLACEPNALLNVQCCDIAVIANFYMEDFEKKAIKQATHKPACWYRYVDDIFIIWPHGKEKLTDFLNHLNGIHNNYGNRR